MTVKQILGKAQSQAETKAVNDLVDKLKGVARDKGRGGAPQSPQPAASPSTPSQAPAGTAGGRSAAPSTAPQPLNPSTGPAGERIASPSSPAPAPEAAPTPEAAIAGADEKRHPSVDLEVYFAYNSHEIGDEALSVLKTLGRALSDQRLAGDDFLIAGHTDAKGGARFNMDLSERRAQAVREFLIANFAISPNRLIAQGFGYTRLKNVDRPLAPENRRVQIVNLSKDAAR